MAAVVETKKVGLASNKDRFMHPNLYNLGTEAGKYKDAMKSFTEKVSAMILEDHGDSAPESRLCHHEYCRQDGCPYNAARHHSHPPQLIRGTKNLANGDGPRR